MKNRKQESLRASARHQRNKRRNRNLINGLDIFHLYGEDTKFSYWDDLGFYLGRYYISVSWTHPRHEFSELCNSEAYEKADKEMKDRPSFRELLDSTIVDTYKKVGRSRKKIAYSSLSGDENRWEFFDLWKKYEDEITTTTDKVIKTKFETFSYCYARGVSICAPIEVRNHEELGKLRDLVVKLLKGETTLEKEFPNYSYSKDDYSKEAPPKGVVCHAVA